MNIIRSIGTSPHPTQKNHFNFKESTRKDNFYLTNFSKPNSPNINLVEEHYDTTSIILVPIWHKAALTLEEAAKYSGIGINKLRDITNEPKCNFVLFVGNKRLIKRKELDEYISKAYSI